MFNVEKNYVALSINVVTIWLILLLSILTPFIIFNIIFLFFIICFKFTFNTATNSIFEPIFEGEIVLLDHLDSKSICQRCLGSIYRDQNTLEWFQATLLLIAGFSGLLMIFGFFQGVFIMGLKGLFFMSVVGFSVISIINQNIFFSNDIINHYDDIKKRKEKDHE